MSQTILAGNITAAADTAFALTDYDIWFVEIDIFIQANDAKIGDQYSQDQTFHVGDFYRMRDVNLRDLRFKNATGGSNTKISFIGTLMSETFKKVTIG